MINGFESYYPLCLIPIKQGMISANEHEALKKLRLNPRSMGNGRKIVTTKTTAFVTPSPPKIHEPQRQEINQQFCHTHSASIPG
jgi:hypothetical protein